jgi:glycosyltransferase involved in cell wall biosynthesis
VVGLNYWRPLVKAGTPLYTIPDIIPTDEIERSAPAHLPPRCASDISDVVVSAGRFCAQKNFGTLVEALALLARKKQFRGFIFGDGPDRNGIRDQIAIKGLSATVAVPGYSEDLWCFMKRASVFVLVSRFEGRPNVLLEAAAAGCPLVVSRIPPHEELLPPDSCCFVEPENPADICRGLAECLDNREAATKRAARARQLVAAWSPEAIGARYTQVYADLTRPAWQRGRGPRPPGLRE